MDSLVPSIEPSHSAPPNPPGDDSPSASPDYTDAPPMSKPLSSDHLDKFASPAPPTASSMTPPPSSQIPPTRIIARTPTPPTPQLTSPPPTSKLPNQPSALTEAAAAIYSQDEIDKASADDLRTMVNEVMNALRDVRLSAAHYKLQYNMAVMESQESTNRMAVELAMAQREIDVLQQAEERRRNAVVPEPNHEESTANATNVILISEMNRQMQMLQSENEELHHVNDQQKRVIEHRQGELASLVEENDRLKTRIRRNREHIAPYLPLLEQMGGSPRSSFGTPHATPRHKTSRMNPPLLNEDSRGQSNFEALLLADKMLSQDTTTAPSTPRLHVPRSRLGHTRGTHSMSSLPQTPNRRSQPRSNVPKTPPTFAAVNIPQSAPPAHYQSGTPHARRESSNSTITASSIDEEEAFTDREEEVAESQASQAATSMLRKVLPPKQTSAPSSQTANLIQSKIYGQVKKGHGLTKSGDFEKRRLQSAEHQHGSKPSKRGRVDAGLGLGIGGLLRES